MKKKQKIKTWDFRRSKWAHFLKLKKLGWRLKQFEFLHGPETSGSPFCPDASGRLPNPMVGEVFGSPNMDVGPEASGLGF